MSKIEKMIEELCPNGVEYVELGEVAEVSTGKSNKSDATENGKYPFFVRSKKIEYMNTYEYEEEAIIIPGEGGVGSIFHYINGRYALHQRVYRIHFSNENTITKFIYYYMVNNFKKFIEKKAVNATVISIRKPMIEKFKIPLPPLPIQEEIVRILDTFTELTKQFKENLEKELTARKKQYEYYREKLLSFGEDVKMVELGEICNKVSSGGTPLTTNKEYYKGNIPWLRTQEINWNDIYDTELKISCEAIKKSSAKVIPKNCVIIAMYGATVGKVCINKIELTTNQACCNLEINKNIAIYRYIFYYLSAKYDILKSLGRGTQNNINSGIIKKFKVPLPPLETQQKIVDILDRFDALCNDISKGLPAEIEARQKQYEYYRDKLLNFKEKQTLV